MVAPGRFDMYIFAQTYWTYDLPDQTQLEVVAGGDMSDDTGKKIYYGHPEAQQGLVLVRHLTDFEPEMGTRKVHERRYGLPVRDGAAYILDGRVEGERMLLTVKSFAGSMYTFDVNQGTFSAPQPPSVTIDGPSRFDPNAAGAPLQVHTEGYDPAGVLLEYTWDLDGDGTFEAKSQTVTLQPDSLEGKSSQTATVRVTSKSGLSATAQAEIRLDGVTPTSTP